MPCSAEQGIFKAVFTDKPLQTGFVDGIVEITVGDNALLL
jgi:hypothetical protein